MKGSFSNNSLRSRKRRCISDNSIDSCKHRSRNCSKIWEPLRKSRRLSENTACLCLRAEATATYGTTEIVASLNKKGVVTESVGDALATQEIPDVADGVIIESSCDAVATQETPDVVDVVVTESLCDAVATQETPNFVNGVVTQSPSDAVATQETSDAEDVVVTESPCDAVSEEGEIIACTSNVNMASEPSMGVQSFSVILTTKYELSTHFSLFNSKRYRKALHVLIEKSFSLFVHWLCTVCQSRGDGIKNCPR